MDNKPVNYFSRIMPLSEEEKHRQHGCAEFQEGDGVVGRRKNFHGVLFCNDLG